MLRKTIVAVSLFAFLSVSTSACADQLNQSAGITQHSGRESCEMSQEQPDFLLGAGAVALTPEEMGEVRGEWLSIAKMAYELLNKGVLAADFWGWEIGRRLAISSGFPDPGSNPDPQGLLGWASKVF